MRYKSLLFIYIVMFGFSQLGLAENSTSSIPRPSKDSVPVILIMGDSLSANFGMDRSQGWVSLLAERLEQESFSYRIINASISGETSSGGLNRFLPLLKKHRPNITILELGANDGLRGQPITLLKNNLSKMIQLAHNTQSQVLLVGMRLPPNYGPQYTENFEKTYQQLAKDYSKIEFSPFLLKNVATRRELLQADGLHPKAKAQPQLLNNIWPYLQPFLEKK